MYVEARYKPARKPPVEAPALTALGHYVTVKLQDGYYGEDVAGVRTVFCEAEDEARRFGAKYVSRSVLEVHAPVPHGADPHDLRSVAAFLNAVPDLLRRSHRALGVGVDFAHQRARADIARLPAPSRPTRWLAPEPDTVDVRQALARDRWLRAHPRSLVKQLVGIRIYDVSQRSGRLTWWDLADVVSIALANEHVLTPGYSEIYVHLATTVAAARREMMTAEWSEAAVAALPRARGNPSLGELLDASEAAVLARASIDHLDRAAIKRAFASIRTAKNFEITRLAAVDRTRTCEARVILAPSGNGHALLARLEITNVRTGARVSHRLPRVDSWGGSFYLFDKLVFRGNAVELHTRTRPRADAARGTRPRVQRFPV